MLLFGAVQIVVSQIPDFHNMAWLSIAATIMSFSYSFIGLGLGIAKVIGMLLASVFILLLRYLWILDLRSNENGREKVQKQSSEIS